MSAAGYDLRRRADALRSAVLTARDLDACRRAAVAAIDELAEAAGRHTRTKTALRDDAVLELQITLAERAVLTALLASPAGCSRDDLDVAVDRALGTTGAGAKRIDVFITKLSRKLSAAGICPYDTADTAARNRQGPIRRSRGWGHGHWSLAPAAAQALRAFEVEASS